MRFNLFRQASLGLLVLLCLVTAGSPTRTAAQDSGTAPADTHDDGFNEGLLCLVGLAGTSGFGHSGLQTQYIISIPVGARCKSHS